MSDPGASNNGKLNVLNRKIIEVKKKIQLSEGQRKANFEEGNTKKRENAEKVGWLKKEVKELQVELSKAINSDDVAEQAARLSRKSSAYMKKRNIQDATAKLDEDNIRLRKKLDLVKYRSEKQHKQLSWLLQQYEELMHGKPAIIPSAHKSSSGAIKKKIIRLENQLHRVSVMQMEADTVRKKYRSVRSSLKADTSFYASCLDGLEESIREQENEIKRLQKVKAEAVELRDATREALSRQEVEAMHTTRERETTLQEYRKRVEDRKTDLERIERLMFQTRQIAQKELDLENKSSSKINEKDVPQSEVNHLEEVFVKLRNATGVSRTEDVLDRFLVQRTTREKLKNMRNSTEEKKMVLEKKRQQLTAEFEMQKFSDTRESDENTEKLAKLYKQIKEQCHRQEIATIKLIQLQDLLRTIGQKLLLFYDKLNEESRIIMFDKNFDINPVEILDKLNIKLNTFMGKFGSAEKFNDLIEQIVSDKIEAMSLETSSVNTKQINIDDQPLFPLFPMVTTPAAQAQASEEEDDIPSRSTLKRQAQLLVDTKSRRKGFAFKR